MNIKIKCNDEFIAYVLDENYKEIREEKSNSFNPDLNNECYLYFSIFIHFARKIFYKTFTLFKSPLFLAILYGL